MLRSALLSSGGMGNVPLLHDELVGQGIATDRMFAESLAVGQVSPGPNGLWVLCLGYFLGGFTGAVVTLVAITLPPLLVIVVEKLYDRHRNHPAVEGFMAGLEVSVIAVFMVVMASFLIAAPRTGLTAAMAVGAFALALWGRIPIVIVLLIAAGIGIWLK